MGEDFIIFAAYLIIYLLATISAKQYVCHAAGSYHVINVNIFLFKIKMFFITS